MSKNKDLKRLVRTRMQKTRESYTTARARILAKSPKSPRSDTVAARVSVVPKDAARMAGMSDAAVEAKTGHTWPEWVQMLDGVGARAMSHRDIAKHLQNALGLRSWWAQTVTVGYERIRGLRDKGQRRGGAYEVNKSKTLALPVEELFAFFAKPRKRGRWLPGAKLALDKVNPSKSMRAKWEDGTSVDFSFVSKSAVKSAVTVQHRGLPTRSEATARRRFWGERLELLASLASTPQRS